MVNRRKILNVYGLISESELRELLVREIYENTYPKFIKLEGDQISREFNSISDLVWYLNTLCSGYSKVQYFSYLSSFGDSVNIKFRIYRWINSFVDILYFDVSFPITLQPIVESSPKISPVRKLRSKYEKLFKPKFINFYF